MWFKLCVCVGGGVFLKNVFRPLYRYMSSVSRHHYCGKALQNLGLYSAPMFFEQIDTSCKTGYLILQSQWKNLPNFVAFLLLAMDTEQTYFNKGQKEIQSWLFVWLRVFVLFLKIIFQSYLYVLIIGAGLQMQKSWPSINERLWRAKSTVPRVKPSVWQWSCHTLFKHPRLLNPKYPTCES